MAKVELYDRPSYEIRGPVLPSYASHLDKFVTIVKAMRGHSPDILEVGGGSGLYAELMRLCGCQVTALDPHPEALYATEAKKITRDFANFEPDGKFDGIHAKDVVCDHIPPAEFFGISASIIQPLGIIMICQHSGYREGYLLRAAETEGFAHLETETWRPEDVQHDWYMGRGIRLLHLFQKNEF